MKTLNEIYTEVMASDELKAKFAAVKSADEAVELVKELGGEATADDITAFLKEKSTKTGELTDAELQQVAGGKGANINEAILSIGTLGFGCVRQAIESAINGQSGTAIENDHLLCDKDF